jgi:dihydrofolate reductase
MRHITVIENLTLDGVMQAPGRPDEDTRDGFAHGGWAVPYFDEVMGRVMGERMATGRGALLLGRRTYEDFAGYWPKQTDNPFTPVLNASTKYVVSRTLQEPLPWENSVLVRDPDELEGDLVVLGSGDLVQSLPVDEYVLSIHPLVLGTGRRLLKQPTALRLVDSVPTTTGVIIATYAS